MNSAIRKAAAPMTGGMICPQVDAAALTAPANSGLYPNHFIMGMVKLPEKMIFKEKLKPLCIQLNV